MSNESLTDERLPPFFFSYFFLSLHSAPMLTSLHPPSLLQIVCACAHTQVNIHTGEFFKKPLSS